MKVTAAALLLCASAVSASEVYGHSPYSGMHRRHVGMMMASTNNDEHRPLRPRHAAAPIDTSAKMIRRIKREPLVVHGSIPVLGTGVQPIIGLTQLNKHDLVERGEDTMHDHNGNQGWNEANVLAASTSSGDDDEDCEEEDDQQAGTGSADDEECEADDDEDDSDLEDCDEDDTDSTQTQSGTSNANSGSSNGNSNNNSNNGAVQDVKVAASSKSSAPTTTSAIFAPKSSAAPSTSAAPKSVSNAQSSNNNAQNNNNNAQNNNNNSDSKKQTSSSNSNGQVFTGGIATFYEQNGNAGACGEKHPDSDKIIALPTALWNNGKNCGRSVSIKDTKTGKTVSAVVKDLCPSCESGTSIDLSIGAMSALLDDFKNKGIAHIEWSFTS